LRLFSTVPGEVLPVKPVEYLEPLEQKRREEEVGTYLLDRLI